MQKMGKFDEKFIGWVKLLLQNATFAVNLNENLGESFNIEQGVHQGCPLVAYLFLIVGEVLAQITKKACVVVIFFNFN